MYATYVYVSWRQAFQIFDCSAAGCFYGANVVLSELVAENHLPGGLIVVRRPSSVRSDIGMLAEVSIIQHRVDENLLFDRRPALGFDIVCQRSCDTATGAVTHDADTVSVNAQFFSMIDKIFQCGVGIVDVRWRLDLRLRDDS